MDDFKKELTTLKNAFGPVLVEHCLSDGTMRGDLDTGKFMTDCWTAIQPHQHYAARFAAFGVYHHTPAEPAGPLTVFDPLPRQGLGRLLPPKRVVIPNADALASFYEIALAQTVNPRLPVMTGTLVFHYFYWEAVGNITQKEIAAMGSMASWFVHQHAMEALELTRDLGL
jgi:hypothetical protein